MFKNQYDTDCQTWSPEGRLHQVEYAMEAVKQGAAVVGICSKKSVVLGAIKRSRQKRLSGYQPKVFKVDDGTVAGISGLTADGRVLCEFLRGECMNHGYFYGTALGVGEMGRRIGVKAQANTHDSGRRPFGVGLLIAGCDGATGEPQLVETCPTGNVYEYRAYAIGNRSQAARTYLEKHAEGALEEEDDRLVLHVAQSLEAACPVDMELSGENVQIAVCTFDEASGVPTTTLLSAAEIAAALAKLRADKEGQEGGGDDEAME